ncbi:MAG: septation protein IspZ [Pseudomonadota bacterium]
MSDTKSDLSNNLGTAADKANQIWGDLVPVMGFVLIYNGLRILAPAEGLVSAKTALFWATGALIVLTVGIIGQKLLSRQPIPLFLIVSSLIVGVFGTLGIVAQNEAFLYVKVTIQQLFLASLIFIPLLFGQNIWREMFKTVFDLPRRAWRTLSIRWGLFFIAMAVWNEYLWRTFAPITEQCLPIFGIQIAPCEAYSFAGFGFGENDAQGVWANWKLGNMVITMIFGALNVPYTLKWLGKTDAEMDAAQAPEASASA